MAVEENYTSLLLILLLLLLKYDYCRHSMTVFKVSLVICNDIKREKEIKKEMKKKERKSRKEFLF